MATRLKFGIALLCAARSFAAFGVCAPSDKSYPGFVTGKGEGDGYESAKSAALADLAGYFSVQLDASSEISEGDGGTDPAYSSSTKSRVSAFMKGAAVLSECQHGESVSVVAGLKKTTARALLDQRADTRRAWIEANLAALTGKSIPETIRRSAKRVLDDEESDLEVWTLLQSPETAFKAIPAPQKQILIAAANRPVGNRRRYRIIASGTVAEQSMIALAKEVRARGFDISDDGDEVVRWSCDVAQGDAIGGNTRFSADCSLGGEDLGIGTVSVSGIAASRNVEATAARLVSLKLQTSQREGE